MGNAGILLHMHTRRSVFNADRTQIGRNHLTSRDCLRGSPLYISVILSECKEISGNSKERVESKGAVQRVLMGLLALSFPSYLGDVSTF